MKVTFLSITLVGAIVGCNGHHQNYSPSKELSPHKGSGELTTSGEENKSFKIDSSKGDKVICGPTKDGFQIYVGPKEYAKNENWGLVISLPQNSKIPGSFVLGNKQPMTKFSYNLSADSTGWYPNRNAEDCVVEVFALDATNIKTKLDCMLESFPLDNSGHPRPKSTLRLTVDVQCNVIDMSR